MKNLLKYFKIVIFVFVIPIFISNCSSDNRKLYFGTWQENWVTSDGENRTNILSISSNRIEYRTSINSRNSEIIYVIENLTWTMIQNTIPTYIDIYPTGFSIRGTLVLKSSDSGIPYSDKGIAAEVGEICTDYWYIHNNSKSLAWGNYRSDDHEPFGEFPYNKM